jgi:RNA polymerase primary sigma factor
LQQELGRQPDAGDIAKRLKMTREEVRDTMRISNTYVSLDESFDGEDDNNLMAYLADDSAARPDQVTFEHTLGNDLRAALTHLDKREERILRLYFGIDCEKPMTLERIGGQMGLTRERIRQIKEKALEKLRSAENSSCLAAYVDE